MSFIQNAISKFKSRNNESKEPDAQTIYFKNGKMYKVYPTDKESWYDARYLVSDGKTYDLEDVKDIKRIPTPDFNKYDPMMEGYGVTGSLDYVIRMKAANARKKGLIAESDELYKKAIVLMQKSGIGYDIKPYLYFAKDLLREGRFEESEREEKRAYTIFENLNKKIAYPHETLSQKLFYDTLENCKRFKIDYIEMMWHNGTCEKCAIYHGRLYCISGKDKRLPKLPKFIIEKGGEIHPGCRHSFRCIDPEIYETIPFRGGDADIFTVSNRPFIDDRTDEEKKAREITLSKIKERNRPYITDTEREYYHIKYTIPDVAPKSLSGYTRMKNSRTANFMKLVDAAKEKGIEIKLD